MVSLRITWLFVSAIKQAVAATWNDMSIGRLNCTEVARGLEVVAPGKVPGTAPAVYGL